MSLQRWLVLVSVIFLSACGSSGQNPPATTTTAPASLDANETKLVDAQLDPRQGMVLEPPLSGQLPRDLIPPI
jgi:hypothetical protein